MTIYKSPQCSCVICQEQFSQKGIHTHYERAHGTTEQQAKYSDGHNGCYDKEEYKNKFRSPRETITAICAYCGDEFIYTRIIDHPTRRTCSRSCLASLSNKDRIKNGYTQPSWTDEMRESASIKSKKLWEDEDYAKRVLENNRRFTSKNEVIIRDYFIDKFPGDEWTYGGSLKVQDELIIRDLYSPKLKICFEYDGVWHFRDIKGQLAKKTEKG
jgi:hypothetical protein